MNVAVVGAGLAGLSAAVELCDLGHRVTVFERRPQAGGKTYSFTDPATGEETDNGQHVFMRCTTEYISFLRRLGTLHLARLQPRLKVRVHGPGGRRSDLVADPFPAPFHLARSFATFRPLAPRDRARIGRLLLRVHRMSEDERLELHGRSLAGWLRAEGQSEAAIGDFWDFVLLPTLNCRAEGSSASDALFVFREGFLKSAGAAAIGLSTVGLTRQHVAPAVAAIEAAGGEVRTSAAVEAIGVVDAKATGLRLASGECHAADAIVIATPHMSVRALVGGPWADRSPFAALAGMRTSPIVNLHLWYDRPVAPFAFSAFTGSELQWVFNRRIIERKPGPREHLVVSLSDAADEMELTKAQLERHFLPLIERALPQVLGAKLERFVAIKEPDATFVPAPGLVRPPSETPISNLVLAGAYTATGWPATMESAVRSGRAAARALDRASPAIAATGGA